MSKRSIIERPDDTDKLMKQPRLMTAEEALDCVVSDSEEEDFLDEYPEDYLEDVPDDVNITARVPRDDMQLPSCSETSLPSQQPPAPSYTRWSQLPRLQRRPTRPSKRPILQQQSTPPSKRPRLQIQPTGPPQQP